MAAMGVRDSLLARLLGNADKFSDEQILQTISMLVEHGVKHGATDIHIEPQERFILVRYRIGGNLKGVYKLPLGALSSVVTQVKRLAHLNPDTTDTPQEGHYATLVDGNDLELTVTTLPVLGGEKVVLHITRHLTSAPSLSELGFWGAPLTELNDALAYNNGLLVVAAPRQNGKTTTMHSMLQLLNTPAVSIATVESTIEYRLNGASQTRVRPQHGITFLEGLQAALNQDPNIVLIGSLPDRPTTDLAVQAAVGGHCIIASTYADTACSAASHLVAFGSEPLLLTTALRATVSQRLVRKLCQHCRERYIPSPQHIEEIETTFAISSVTGHRRVNELEQQAAKAGIDHNTHVNTTPAHITGLWRAAESGCEHCGHSGYAGIVAITEVLVITDPIRNLMLKAAPANLIHRQALTEGFLPMGLDGLVKALRGQTTVEEVLRVL